MKKTGNFRMLLRNLRKQKEQEEDKPTLVLSNVVKSGCRYCNGHNILSFDNDKYCKDCDKML